MTSRKAIEAANIVAEYCREQRSCQNCIFRQIGGDHWNCQINAFDIQEVLGNLEAKKNHGGYL